MALVTTYSTLKAHIADTLNRTDLTSVIPNFIQQFEKRAQRGIRLEDGSVVQIRRLTDRGTISVSSDDVLLPTDLVTLEALYHDGTTYHGPIEIVAADQIGRLKGGYGDTGVPQFAANTGGRLRFAPVPDGTYSLKMTYWQGIPALSDTVTTNWLLTEAPDGYLYGSLVEAYTYLKDLEKRSYYEGLVREFAAAHDMAQQNKQFGGTLTRRNFSPIGG